LRHFYLTHTTHDGANADRPRTLAHVPDADETIEYGDRITFDVADENHTKAVVYDGEMPETMSKGRLVVAEGQFDGETVHATSLTVRAHEGEDAAPEGHDHDYNGTGDGYNGTDVPPAPS